MEKLAIAMSGGVDSSVALVLLKDKYEGLENAASIAGMFLTTECVIVEKKEDKPEMPMNAGMGGMGGMM